MSDNRFSRISGSGSFNGSNRFQMNAMDLQTRPRPLTARGVSPAAASSSFITSSTSSIGGSARYGDNSALSARNMLIRHKLMERKRFDSADYAMDKNKRQKEGDQDDQAATESVPPPTTAQVGVSAFYSALQDQQPTSITDVSPPVETSSRYGALARGGAASARSILLQKKLREKKHFDSADYQLAQQLSPSTSSTSSASSTSSPSTLFVGITAGSSGGSSPMDVDNEDDAGAMGGINSPSAARVGVAGAISSGERRLAQMSPSVRGGGAFGGSFGSPTRRAGQYGSLQPQDEDTQRFFVPAATTGGSGGGSDAAAAPASKYGKLCAAHVLIRRQLRERKRFDSADYAMEKQSGGGGGQDEPAAETKDEDEGGSAGALLGGHVVMTAPAAHHEHATDAATPSFLTRECCDSTSPSISHQVKHIKLSEDARAATSNGMGWAATATASSSNSGGSRAAAMSQDSRLAARSIILQRKLAERKRFDSADYYKARSTTSG